MAISKSKPTGKASKKISRATAISAEQRHGMIAEAAYHRAKLRDFQGGDPVADWLAAEAEIDVKIVKSS